MNTKTRRPHSGQKMVEWNELDVASFLEQVTGFLAEHGQLDGPACNAPPAKRARSVRLSLKASLNQAPPTCLFQMRSWRT